MTDKLGPSQLDRTAVVYVRQSSMTQVRENTESRRRQYDLAAHARTLGFRKVEVIDDDLGKSGSGKVLRPGFAKLVGRLCEGDIGAILIIEASRIARNAQDWHRVVDLCALTETVLIDFDGVYDPRQLNDRLLLGLKGTMAEFELGLIRQRCQEALKNMRARGAVMWRPPVGYVRDAGSNTLDKTPDLQVQHAVQTVFEKFRELGSGRQVFLWLQDAGIQLPATVKGTAGHEVHWSPVRPDSVLRLLRNPFYAGTFVWPQRTSKVYIEAGRARTKPGARLTPDEWQIVHHDHHPAYITWAEFTRNQAQLMENNARQKQSRRAVGEGEALFTGLMRCGHCGLKLRVSYLSHARYICPGRAGAKGCLSFGNDRFDGAVASTVLAALGPLGVEASARAWRDLRTAQDAMIDALGLALERADYEARLAHRRYLAVDPDNRLVASELEHRWNEALIVQATARARLEEARLAQPDELTDEDERRLATLGQDLHQLWNHPDAPLTLKKRILRTALDEILVKLDTETSELVLTLRWQGGDHTSLRVPKHRSGRNRRAIDPAAIEHLRELALLCDDTAIARILNMNGVRTGPGNSWTEARVRSYRERNHIPVFRKDAERTWVTMAQAAHELGVAPATVRRLIRDDILEAHQCVPNAPWQIERRALERPDVRAAAESARTPARSRRDSRQVELF